MENKNQMKCVKFEVSGKVQGVFFRKCTKEASDKYGVKGWVLNTPQGTVQGQLEGSADSVDKMKHWLSNVGSRRSRVEKLEIVEESSLEKAMTKSFTIVRDSSEVNKRMFKMD